MNFYNDPEKSVYKKFMKNAKKKNNPEKILKNPAEILKDPFTAKPKKNPEQSVDETESPENPE